ncbi:MAG: hypothetical protein Tsb005_04910 [Gammaproteobacteria bacterium]
MHNNRLMLFCSPLFLFKRITNRLSLYVLRINKWIFFSNWLRMTLYKTLTPMLIGNDSIIWAGNIFNVANDFRLGSNCIIGPRNVFLIRGGIKIGNNVNISGFSFFISQGHDVDDPYMHTTVAKIVIEDDAWLATHVTIMPGVKIGRGAVVAAGAVVTKDVSPFTVVAGNPARVIKKRSDNVQYKINDCRGMKWL